MAGEAFEIQSIRRRGEAPVNEEAFSIQPLHPPAAAPQPVETAPVAPAGTLEFGSTPGGAATMARSRGGRPEISAPNPTATRIGLETAGSFLGGSLGAGGAALLTKSPALTALGLRGGEAAGASAGSLLSEVFDPTEKPLQTAAEAGLVTLATGAAASGAGTVLRRALGRPHEAGQAAIDILAQQGKVPPAGAVLDGGFASDMQAIGSGAAFVGRKIEKALAESKDVISGSLDNYVSQFQRYHDGAKWTFDNVNTLLEKSGVGTSRIVRLDKNQIEAIRPAIEAWKREGVLDKVPADLGWLRNLPDETTAIKLTLNEAEAVRGLLFNRARALEGGPKEAVTSAAGTDIVRAVKSTANEIGAGIDKALDTAIRDGRIGAGIKGEIATGKALWKQWKMGEEVENMVLKASKDVTGDASKTVGMSLLNQLDSIAREESKIGHAILDTDTKAAVRRYAIALKALEESGKDSSFKLVARSGQLIGLSALGAALGGSAPTMGAGGAIFALAPPILAYVFSNPAASALLIRGLKLPEGSAAQVRVAREFATLLTNEGFFPPSREPAAPEAN